jgi:hypothetical protein
MSSPTSSRTSELPDEDETVTDWIKRSIQTRLARHDHEFWNSATVPVEAELPPGVALAYDGLKVTAQRE